MGISERKRRQLHKAFTREQNDYFRRCARSSQRHVHQFILPSEMCFYCEKNVLLLLILGSLKSLSDNCLHFAILFSDSNLITSGADIQCFSRQLFVQLVLQK